MLQFQKARLAFHPFLSLTYIPKDRWHSWSGGEEGIYRVCHCLPSSLWLMVVSPLLFGIFNFAWGWLSHPELLPCRIAWFCSSICIKLPSHCCAVGLTGIHGDEQIQLCFYRSCSKKSFNCSTKHSSFLHLLPLQPNQVPHTAGRCREIPQPEKIIRAGQRQKLSPE